MTNKVVEQEVKLENIEFVDNKDIPFDVRIKQRLEELKDIREKTVEQLKIQQQLALNPVDAAISELTALLPPKEEKEELKP